MVVQQHMNLKFHPLCNRVNLSHLCFADDLILFCKGEKASIELLVNAFTYFFRAYGLVMNAGKSNFYCNGMDDWLVKEIEVATGMKKGTVPIKYLGVNVSPKRLSVLDCEVLVEKVIGRIRSMGSRKLSYIGRLVMIKFVFSTLHNYWARIFVISKTVIGKIEAICRGYLWHGSELKESRSLVAWEKICKP
ncbi:uncharacterized protein LOC141607771 [Silene latifolia]|uniref:uncharacterized protein LOC141607771 n=1 Tax=Silene latifolia TaxID=37657 RepID=UPI003D7852FE